MRLQHHLRLICSVAALVTIVGANATAQSEGQGVSDVIQATIPGLWPRDFEAGFQVGPSINVVTAYTGELLTNTRGGISTSGATRYQALLDVAVTCDLEKTRVPLPGRVFLLGQNTHGEGITEDFVGDKQVVSNIDSFENIAQVSEYWWQLDLCDERVALRLGKQDLNTEFLHMLLAEDFIQSSFGISPSANFPTYPNPSMAAVALVKPFPNLMFRVGHWDALADGGNWGFSGNELTFTFGEVEYKYSLLDGRLPGTIDVGVAYGSGGEVQGLTFPSGYGYYIQLEQIVFRENQSQEDKVQGVGVFFSFFPRFVDDPVPVTAIENNVVFGAVYKGILPSRDDDIVGLGVAWARLNTPGPDEETAIELFYKFQFKPRLSVQPDLQYIASPSGVERDAFVAGTRFQVVF